ncbi:MAG: calcium-binding protein [Hyphomicrobiaceae bacterium]|nr:calcium-binding protein [Hyphomicrobiaceae bacterium]
MTFIRNAAFCVLAAAALATTNAAPADAGHRSAKAHPSCPALNAIDPDGDGAMTLGEAKRAAIKTFMKLNKDGDITLELDELGGRMSAAAFAQADLIKGRGISLGEYLIEVRRRFKWANPDKDHTIECDELHSKYGRLLARLLK